ncbi:acyl-CoA synthetase (NDP forming) [Variovorax guangxiensis]|nr:acyl-CoA synthetase (NDP forming) [Variovorax guangxiensis]
MPTARFRRSTLAAAAGTRPPRREQLQTQLPALASLTDLIDLSEEAEPSHYKAAIEAAGSDPQVDGVLAIFSPKAGSDGSDTARMLCALPRPMSKPLLTCWMGDATVGDSRALLAEAGIPSFRTPEAAVGAFGNIAAFYQNQQLLQQTPAPLSALAKPDVEAARPGTQRARGHDDRDAVGLSGGPEGRLAGHQPQVGCRGRGAQPSRRSPAIPTSSW